PPYDYLEVAQHVVVEDGVGVAASLQQSRGEDDLFKDIDFSKTTDADMASVQVSLDFGAYSKVLTEDNVENGVVMCLKGERMAYGISFTSLSALKDLPVKIRHRNEAHLYLSQKPSKVISGDEMSFNPSLLEVYYAIVY